MRGAESSPPPRHAHSCGFTYNRPPRRFGRQKKNEKEKQTRFAKVLESIRAAFPPESAVPKAATPVNPAELLDFAAGQRRRRRWGGGGGGGERRRRESFPFSGQTCPAWGGGESEKLPGCRGQIAALPIPSVATATEGDGGEHAKNTTDSAAGVKGRAAAEAAEGGLRRRRQGGEEEEGTPI